nr:MAG TPA: hypothetical protein [Caudoviricetes sp.]
MKIKDSGARRSFESGAVRDVEVGKGRCDLMPLEVVGNSLNSTIISLIDVYLKTKETGHLYMALVDFLEESKWTNMYDMYLDVSKHFEEGALKYGENNWQKGIPIQSYIDSAVRHYLKYKSCWNDEPHDRAFVWNIICCIWEHLRQEREKKIDD